MFYRSFTTARPWVNSTWGEGLHGTGEKQEALRKCVMLWKPYTPWGNTYRKVKSKVNGSIGEVLAFLPGSIERNTSMCVLPEWMCVHHVYAYVSDALELELMAVMSPKVGAGNHIQALPRRSRCSQPMSHLSSPWSHQFWHRLFSDVDICMCRSSDIWPPDWSHRIRVKILLLFLYHKRIS